MLVYNVWGTEISGIPQRVRWRWCWYHCYLMFLQTKIPLTDMWNIRYVAPGTFPMIRWPSLSLDSGRSSQQGTVAWSKLRPQLISTSYCDQLYGYQWLSITQGELEGLISTHSCSNGERALCWLLGVLCVKPETQNFSKTVELFV